MSLNSPTHDRVSPHLAIAEILHGAIDAKRRRNSSYSLRAAARDLGVSHSYLSLLLSGKKKLSLKRAIQFVQLLKMEAPTSTRFLQAVALGTMKGALNHTPFAAVQDPLSLETTASFAHLELDRFRTLSDWWHIAILDLTLLKGFRSDPTWISRQLGIHRSQAEAAIERLQRLGLLAIVKGKLRKTSAKLALPTHAPDRAIRDYHSQMIEKARQQLELDASEDFQNREISGATLTVAPHRIPEAKKMIAAFERKLVAFLSEGECTQLFQLNVQLFPLTPKPQPQSKENL